MRIFKRICVTLLVLALLAAILSAVWYFFLRDGSTFLALAERFETAEEYEWAVRCYRWAWAREPYNTSIPLALAKCHVDNGNYTKCEATLWEAIGRTPGDASLYLMLSRVYVAQDKLLDAAHLDEQITHPDAKAAFLDARPAAPVIQPAGGKYDEDCTVSLSYTSGTAYWTLNGDYPSVGSDLYTAPVRLVGQTATVVALIVGDNGTVSPIATADYAVGFVDEPVTIADPALDALLRQTMGWVDSVQLTTSLLAQVQTLTLTPEVADLSQLSLLVNLTSLDASALGRSADWRILAGLTQLETLLLPPATLDSASLSTIGTLYALHRLSLAGCGVTTLAPLESLTALEELNLSNCSVGDCTPLSGMVRLRTLQLDGNAVTDLSPLSNLTALENLSLDGNPINDLTPLQNLRQIRTLRLSSTGIDSLDALTRMSGLETLDASGNAITVVEALSELAALTDLNLSSNAITSIEPLAGLTSLLRLDVSDNQLTTLPDFADTCALAFFSAAHNQLADLEGLANLPNLNYVYVDYNQIQTLEPLETCLVLVQVDAFENPVRVAQALIDSGVIIHYTPTFDDETGRDVTVEPDEATPADDSDGGSDNTMDRMTRDN